jgi:hypothetical protein
VCPGNCEFVTLGEYVPPRNFSFMPPKNFSSAMRRISIPGFTSTQDEVCLAETEEGGSSSCQSGFTLIVMCLISIAACVAAVFNYWGAGALMGDFKLSTVTGGMGLTGVMMMFKNIPGLFNMYGKFTERNKRIASQKQYAESKRRAIEQYAKRYRIPLALSAFELKKRIQQLTIGFLYRFKHQRPQKTEEHKVRDQQYARLSTLYAFGEFFAHVEIIRREVFNLQGDFVFLPLKEIEFAFSGEDLDLTSRAHLGPSSHSSWKLGKVEPGAFQFLKVCLGTAATAATGVVLVLWFFVSSPSALTTLCHFVSVLIDGNTGNG